MILRSSLIRLSPCLFALALWGCPAEEDAVDVNNSKPDTTQDEAMDVVSTSDETPDLDGGMDTTVDEEPDEVSAPDASDSSDDQTTCDPNEVAASEVAVHTTVASSVLETEPLEKGWRVVLDASVGGAAQAAVSSFVYLDLDGPEVLSISDQDAHTDDRWELAFKRTEIRTNSADSGPRSILLARVEASTFDDAAAPNAQGGSWVTDDFVTDECEVLTFGRGSLQTAFDQWYAYDPSTHGVSAPEGVFYFMYDPVSHAVTKFAIESYSDATYTLRWE